MSQGKVSNDGLEISLTRELAKSTYLGERTDTQINAGILPLPDKNHELGHLADGTQKQTERQLRSEEVLTSEWLSECLKTGCLGLLVKAEHTCQAKDANQKCPESGQAQCPERRL